MFRLSLLCLILAMSTVAQAASVVWSATVNGLDSSSGADLAAGSLVRVGTFDLTDAEIIASAFNIPFLDAHFTEFGNTVIGAGGTAAGHFSTQSNNNSATATALAGSQIYVWAFASGTVANATEHGVFYMPKATDLGWQFPAVPLPGFTQIELQDLTDAASSTTLRAEARVLIGTFGPGTSNDTGKPNFTLQLVPEPTSATLLMAAAGLIGFVRRRS
jgi:hypothetical protein